jgi:hypothetical protein
METSSMQFTCYIILLPMKKIQRRAIDIFKIVMWLALANASDQFISNNRTGKERM